jgi:hypothetical protein
VRGEYNRNGYDVWIDGAVVYAAGNHVHDSTQYALSARDRLPLKALRKFCLKTAREIAAERRGVFAGVERVTENGQP